MHAGHAGLDDIVRQPTSLPLYIPENMLGPALGSCTNSSGLFPEVQGGNLEWRNSRMQAMCNRRL